MTERRLDLPELLRQARSAAAHFSPRRRRWQNFLRELPLDPDRSLAERVGMKLNTFLQNVTRARRLLADCLRRRGVDLDLELS